MNVSPRRRASWNTAIRGILPGAFHLGAYHDGDSLSGVCIGQKGETFHLFSPLPQGMVACLMHPLHQISTKPQPGWSRATWIPCERFWKKSAAQTPWGHCLWSVHQLDFRVRMLFPVEFWVRMVFPETFGVRMLFPEKF